MGDGILVEADVTGSVIERNAADRNTDDGIDVESASTTLTRNTANRNSDLGIEAVPGIHEEARTRQATTATPSNAPTSPAARTPTLPHL